MIKEKVDMSTMTRDDLYAEFLKSKLKKSQDDKRNSRFTTLEEFRIEMEEMYKEDYAKYLKLKKNAYDVKI